MVSFLDFGFGQVVLHDVAAALFRTVGDCGCDAGRDGGCEPEHFLAQAEAALKFVSEAVTAPAKVDA